MGLFKNLFTDNNNNNEDSTKKIDWIQLTESNKLVKIISQSTIKPILIFKHSTRCGISRMALKSFEKECNLIEATVDFYFLDLLKHRMISNEISEKLNVQHQSPQVIVIKNKEVIYHNSHYQISVDTIKKIIEEY